VAGNFLAEVGVVDRFTSLSAEVADIDSPGAQVIHQGLLKLDPAVVASESDHMLAQPKPDSALQFVLLIKKIAEPWLYFHSPAI
jgi:hypothetical protein